MLNNHTYYSLRYGTIEPKEFLALSAENGYDCVALTDINCTAGLIDFCRLAPKYGVRPVAGIDFRNGAQQKYVGVAKNNEGFRELCAHLSHHLQHEIPFGDRAPNFENVFVVYPFDRLSKNETQNEGDALFTLSSPLLGHEFIGISIRDIARLKFPPSVLPTHKLVVLHTSTFKSKHDFNAHRLLRAIANNTLLSKLPKSEEGHPEDKFISRNELEKTFEEFPHIFKSTTELLATCEINFEIGNEYPHKNQRNYLDSAAEDNKLLEKLCEEGLAYRYPAAGENIYVRLKKELEIIREKNFVSYFLINWDITKYARYKGYFYVGRGSGANSIVAYLLRITDVDPIELDLYFERFINLFRQNPPDFDIDFSWTERDDVTQYIFSRFKNVTLLGAFVTFQYSAVIRELGKVFGLPKHEIDKLSDRNFREDELDSMHKLVLYYSKYIHGFPNYISIHAAGILITEKPIHYYGGTFMPPKGFATAQFDMHQAEDIGINKLDILSQRGLSKIKDTLNILRYNQPEKFDFDIHDVARFKKDERCNFLLQTAQAIGCFYVESPAMRMLLTKLRTHDYLGLVAASSVIRPGVSSSGMMRQYILRERFPEKRNDAPKALLNLMPETYGVMVYQEDVIKVAHYFAGLSLGEADVLRRGMSGKFRGREEFDRAAKSFYEGAVANGNSPEMVKEVWRQVESFAGYAFAKGHSASYAVESYQCLFLKAYFPIEYMVACINNYGGFYRTEIYVHEARLNGALIEAPCANTSMNESVLFGKTIYLGFQFTKSLESEAAFQILLARKDGRFESLDDFLDRVNISLEQCVLLARVNAFRFCGRSKKDILWHLQLRLGNVKKTNPLPKLFATAVQKFALPHFEHHWLEDVYDELELIGFPLCNPFDLIIEEISGDSLAKNFHQYIGKEISTIGYYVTMKPTRTSRGDRMFFANFLDREGQFIDTVHFPPVAEKFPVIGWGLFLITGKVCEEFESISIEVSCVRKLKLLSDPRLEDTPSHPALMRKKSTEEKWLQKALPEK